MSYLVPPKRKTLGPITQQHCRLLAQGPFPLTFTIDQCKCTVKKIVFISYYILEVWFMKFNATFNNISVISWQSVLLVEEIRVPGENHRPVASHNFS